MSKKYASIDIGTNSVRCLLATIENMRIIESSKSLRMTRIGDGVHSTRCLNDERMIETVMAINAFKKEAISYGAEKIFIMATSAVRDANNRDVFIQRVKSSTGLDVEILSGDKEASVGFLGVLMGSDKNDEKKLVIDIGGGSTEFIAGDQSGIIVSKSIDIGAVRLTNIFGEKNSVKLIEYIHEQADEILNNIKNLEIDAVVGIGGTATTFAAIKSGLKEYHREIVHNQIVLTNEIRQINKKLTSLTLEDRRMLPGLDPKRADIIVAGGLILETVLSRLGCGEIVISDYDNLEGYLFECLKEKQSI